MDIGGSLMAKEMAFTYRESFIEFYSCHTPNISLPSQYRNALSDSPIIHAISVDSITEMLCGGWGERNAWTSWYMVDL
jgi:hypothetical protein